MDDILIISSLNQLHYPTLKDFKNFLKTYYKIVEF